MNTNEIVRRQLLSAALGQRNVTQVDVREILFQPGQQTGRHLHPCPVLGYIVEGTALFQRSDAADVQTLVAGSAFYEPAGTVILRFDNASATEPMRFIAYYLLDGEQELIQMLPE
ncbi:cupin domain-containing protein [Granulicella arctica]|uniref:Quercetin dioxygenase-like cupin family protein n=1 Tax=Granulicella arctica TaxID=940613 RepID=A0A7Y9TJH6_9BACT|nr:cupin domain-containing protein [Granulicella arctica]NYF78282.1 quercetin dioxygenase-like cupin family protein [Granulicella arctica]